MSAVKGLKNMAHSWLTSVHPETLFADVILRSPANYGTTKNLVAKGISRDSSLSLS